MAEPANGIEVYLEVGKKRTMAGAVEWPGWCRGGQDESSALQALFDYGPRYAEVLDAAGLSFQAPVDVSEFNVIERLEGDSGTDFGVPAIPPSADERPVDEAETSRLRQILRACWLAFDTASAAAEGVELRKGPCGGGREREKIIRHVLESEQGYIRQTGYKLDVDDQAALGDQLVQVRQAVLQALSAGGRGELPERGPRGGLRWKPRYFARRTAWHVLDHAWEMEDRMV